MTGGRRPVFWTQTPLESASGLLLVSPDCPPDLIEAVLHYSFSEVDDLPPVNRGNGSYALARQLGTKVIKISKTKLQYPSKNYPGNISDLRVNISLQRGLEQTNAVVSDRYYLKPTVYSFAAPQIYAAVVPIWDANLPIPKATSIMDFAEGIHPSDKLLPPATARDFVYTRALEASEIDTRAVDLDDAAGGNMLLQIMDGLTKVMKIDARAKSEIIF